MLLPVIDQLIKPVRASFSRQPPAAPDKNHVRRLIVVIHRTGRLIQPSEAFRKHASASSDNLSPSYATHVIIDVILLRSRELPFIDVERILLGGKERSTASS